MIVVTVEGLEGLRASLEQREKKLSGDMVKRAFATGAETIAATARATVPHKTGFLELNIEVKARRAKDLAVATVIIPKANFPRFPYGLVQEKGWFAGKLNRKWIKGSGFFSQALLQHAEDVPENIVNKIKAEIEADQ